MSSLSTFFLQWSNCLGTAVPENSTHPIPMQTHWAFVPYKTAPAGLLTTRPLGMQMIATVTSSSYFHVNLPQSPGENRFKGIYCQFLSMPCPQWHFY